MSNVPQAAHLAAAELLLQLGTPAILVTDETTGVVSRASDDEGMRILHLLRAREQRLTAMLGRPS
ncbi:MAG: hypothetical protein HYW81_01480 [Parcubacteria group bacterium]|nr:hypothetical protein [Parcubacteria group bacterium]